MKYINVIFAYLFPILAIMMVVYMFARYFEKREAGLIKEVPCEDYRDYRMDSVPVRCIKEYINY